MGKITEYKVVTATSPIELTKEVNELIQTGWIPTGGIFVAKTDFVREVEGHLGKQSINIQAMVKISD